MNMQELVNVIGEAGRNARKDYHLTLGGLIEALEAAGPEVPVVFDRGGSPGMPHSYRGYYSDLSFPAEGALSASEVLKNAKRALVTTYEGYKGGDFKMGRDTPLWSASYGCTGLAIIGITTSPEAITLITKQID